MLSRLPPVGSQLAVLKKQIAAAEQQLARGLARFSVRATLMPVSCSQAALPAGKKAKNQRKMAGRRLRELKAKLIQARQSPLVPRFFPGVQARCYGKGAQPGPARVTALFDCVPVTWTFGPASFAASAGGAGSIPACHSARPRGSTLGLRPPSRTSCALICPAAIRRTRRHGLSRRGRVHSCHFGGASAHRARRRLQRLWVGGRPRAVQSIM